MQPRWYQVEAVDAFFHFVAEAHKAGMERIAPLILLPTGTGKSPVLAITIKRLLTKWPRVRVLKLTHVKELVEQNADKLRKVWPNAPLGIISAGLKRCELGRPITYAGIASVYKMIDQLGHIDVLFVDEAHWVSTKEKTMYAKVILALWKRNPKMVLCGLTATGWRTKGGRLEQNENAFFTGVAYDGTTFEHWERYIADRHLVPLIARPTDVELKYENVQVSNTGDFNLKQLQEAVDDLETTRQAVNETIAKAAGRKSGLVYGVGIEHVMHIYQFFRERGERVTFVHSKISDDERDQRIAAFKRGEYRWLVNNGILTTGFDHPPLDVIAVMRPTKSSALHGQILGRGTRPWDGVDENDVPDEFFPGYKNDCLVLDFARNTRRLGTIDDLKVPGEDGAKKRAPKAGMAVCRLCPDCETYCPARANTCHKCGYEFPPPVVNIEGTAGEDAPMKAGRGLRREKEHEPNQTAYFDVDQVVYGRVAGRGGKPDYLGVTYHCGLRRFRENVFLEHPGDAMARAHRWWRERSDDPFVPATVAEAVERMGELRTPSRIYVWLNRKPNPEVLNHVFQDA